VPLRVTLVAALLSLVTLGLLASAVATNRALNDYLVQRTDVQLTQDAGSFVRRLDAPAWSPWPRAWPTPAPPCTASSSSRSSPDSPGPSSATSRTTCSASVPTTSRTRASGGTGLGLSIVAALVSAHGGSVSVYSQPGQGATFRVLLPRGPRDPRGGWLPARLSASCTTLHDLAPDIASSDVFLCGPEGWMRSVRDAARAAGVPDRQIHREHFTY